MSEKSDFDVYKIAALARLNLSENEANCLKKDLQKIVEHIDQMSELNVDEVEPTAHAVPLVNVLREDISKESFNRDLMLKNAPSLVDDELIKVHQVVDSH